MEIFRTMETCRFFSGNCYTYSQTFSAKRTLSAVSIKSLGCYVYWKSSTNLAFFGALREEAIKITKGIKVAKNIRFVLNVGKQFDTYG